VVFSHIIILPLYSIKVKRIFIVFVVRTILLIDVTIGGIAVFMVLKIIKY